MPNKNLSQHLALNATMNRVFTAPQAIPPSEFWLAHLENGGSSGMNVNGSVTPVSYRWTCPADHFFMFQRFIFQIVDAGLDWNLFGGIAALTNGVVFSIYDSDDTILAQFPPLKVNYEVSMVFGGGNAQIRQGAALGNLIAIFNIPEQIGYVLTLTEGQYVEAVIQDDLTALTHMDALVTGRMVPEDPR